MESEHFNRNFFEEFGQLACLMFENVAVFEELAAEAAENKDISAIHLGRACALPHWEEVRAYLYRHPFFLRVGRFRVESLNRVEVFLTH